MLLPFELVRQPHEGLTLKAWIAPLTVVRVHERTRRVTWSNEPVRSAILELLTGAKVHVEDLDGTIAQQINAAIAAETLAAECSTNSSPTS